MKRCALLIVLVLWAGLAASAAAQSGVTYDEDSPAGKEYAIPLEAARGVGGGGSGAPGSTPPTDNATSGPALFGVGIAKASKDKAQGGKSGGVTKPTPSEATPGSQPATESAEVPAETRSIRTVAGDADSSQLQLGGILLAVAVISAAVVGVTLRRGRVTG